MNFTKKFAKKIAVIFFILPFICVGCVKETIDPETGTVIVTEADPEQEINTLIESLYLAEGPYYAAACQKLIDEYGEQALPQLAEGTKNNLQKIRLGCLFCIGEIYYKTKSPQALEYKEIIAERLQKDRRVKVRLQAARTLCEPRSWNPDLSS